MNKLTSKKGFTLIELLAVIIILGVLLLIAIPSVTEYISTSRKKTYLATAGRYIDAVINKVNALDYNFSDKDTLYYVPYNCIELEKGGKSPYGNWKEAYVVVVFNGEGYKYYWTSVDDAGMEIPLTLSKDLDADKITGGMTKVDMSKTIEGRTKLGKIDAVSCNAAPTIGDIPEGGEDISPVRYKISFDCNEVECTMDPTEKEVENGSTYGELPTPVRIGYTFLGWYTEKEEGEWIKIFTTVELTADQTLYAHWSANTYTVSYNCNGISCSLGTKTVTYGGAYGTLATPPTRDGYSFEGWYTATSGGSKIENATNVTITANQTLYAQWKVVLPKLADVVSIGDYVNYDAGTWTETKAKPSSYFTFGGYTSGSSRNSSVSCNNQAPSSSGWRVLSKNTSTGEVKLIHAGQPECYFHGDATNGRGNSEKILTGSTGYYINGGYPSTPMDWSMYVNSTYAVSATAFTKPMLDNWYGSTVGYGTIITNNDLIKTNAIYWLGSAYPDYDRYLDYMNVDGRVNYNIYGELGVRPVVTMKSNITTTGKVGNVWQLQ